MRWFLRALEQGRVHRGRAHREEYWVFVLFHVVFSPVIALVEYPATIVSYVLSLKGTPGENRFGPEPHADGGLT